MAPDSNTTTHDTNRQDGNKTKSARERYIDWYNQRPSKYLGEPYDQISMGDFDGRLLLTDALGFPVEYNFVMLLAEIIIESYSDLCEEDVLEIIRDKFEERTHRPRTRDASTRKVTNHKPGFVYLLQVGEYFKIGYASNVERRVRTLQPSIPWQIEVITTIQTDSMLDLENELHKKFANKRVNGEWFVLAPEDVAYIKFLGDKS